MARKRGFHVPIKGVKSYRSNGRRYYYDRTTGLRVLSEPWTPEFLAELQAMRAARRKLALPPGTLGAVIEAYKASDTHWGVLKPATQLSYGRAFAALDPIKMAPVAAMSRPAILKLRDDQLLKKHGRWMANYAVTVLGVLFSFAYDRGLLASNPLAEKVRKIRKEQGAPKQNRPWTAEERRVVLVESPWHIRIVLAMAMCLGIRYSDILRAPISALAGGDFRLRTQKRDVPIRIPIHPVLAAAIAERPASAATTICLNSEGKPWKSGFNASWAKFRNALIKAGKIGKGLTLHGLRHTLGIMLKEAGLDDSQIADVLGQTSTAMARFYAEGAALPESSKAAVLEMDWTGKKANRNV